MSVFSSLLGSIRSPVAKLCLATSAATAIFGGMAFLIECAVAPWDHDEGLFVVSAFYFVLGIISLAQQEPSTTFSLPSTWTTIENDKESLPGKFAEAGCRCA